MGTNFEHEIGREPEDSWTPYSDVLVLPTDDGGWAAAGTRPHTSSPDIRACEHDLTWRRAMVACSTESAGFRNTDAVSWRDGKFEVGAFGLSLPAHIALLMATMLHRDPLRYVHVMRDAPFYPKVARGATGFALWWLSGRGVSPRDTVAMISRLLQVYPSCDAQAITLRSISESLWLDGPEYFHTLEYKRLWACALMGEVRQRELTRGAMLPFTSEARRGLRRLSGDVAAETVIERIRETGPVGDQIVDAVEDALYA